MRAIISLLSSIFDHIISTHLQTIVYPPTAILKFRISILNLDAGKATMMHKVEDTDNQTQSFAMLPSTLTPNYFDQSTFHCFLYTNKPILLSMVHKNE